ncbi:MAG: hypothetical protein AAGF12_00360 [Myxococcota bacterium]
MDNGEVSMRVWMTRCTHSLGLLRSTGAVSVGAFARFRGKGGLSTRLPFAGRRFAGLRFAGLRFAGLLLAGALFAGVGCEGSVTPSEGTAGPSRPHGSQPGGGQCGTTEVQEVFARNGCLGCHNESPDLAGGGLDLMSARLTTRLMARPSRNPTCSDDFLLDPMEPGASLLLRTIAPDRYAGFGNESCVFSPMPLATEAVVPREDVNCLEEWIGQLDGELPEPEVLVAHDAFTVLSKVKYVLHGGVVTLEELEAVTAPDGSADPTALSEVVESWMETDEFHAKRRQFLELTLQQSPADTNYFFQYRNTRSIRLSGLRENLRMGMIRTAERIIDANEDFRTIVTTRDWEMTTLLLLALKLGDNPPDKPDGKFRKDNPMNDMREVLREDETAYDVVADAEDWRTVTILHDPTSTHMTEGPDFMDAAYAEELRSIPNGGTVTLRAPRLGFFTTPAFFQTWLTNRDNEFRVTANQALLIALGRTFTAGDPTLRNVGDEGVDLDLFPPGTECYGCHKNIEGMRVAWLSAFDPVHTRQRAPEAPFSDADFSFQGLSMPIATLEDWAEAVASHPAFAKAWVLKVCQWASSIECDEHNETVRSLAEDFERSGHNLTHLIRAFFSSELVTHTSPTEGSEFPGAQVSIARSNHYCHAMRTRLSAIRAAEGGSPTSRADICNRGNTQPILASSIPTEQWTRGAPEFHQPSSFGAMSAVSFQGLCALAAEDVAGRQGILPVNEPERALDVITADLLGFPRGSARYEARRETLQELYDRQVAVPICADAAALSTTLQEGSESCGLGLDDEAALANIWTIVCQSPALTGVGL